MLKFDIELVQFRAFCADGISQQRSTSEAVKAFRRPPILGIHYECIRKCLAISRCCLKPTLPTAF